MKLKINTKEDKKLLQNFPNDPYSDITIITKSSKLRLAMAYLSIDSDFFAQVDPSCKQIDLSMLSEQPLIAVLRSLYGGQLQATSVADLQEIYSIIETLSIGQYKEMLIQAIRNNHQLKKQSSLFNSIEMLQFCLRNNILGEQICNYHFQNRLKMLQSSKNYLQLGKLSEKSLNYLLINFHQKEKEKGDTIINHILENYFNRKNYRPADYLLEEGLTPLKQIWQKFHHKIATKNIGEKSQNTFSSTIIESSSVLPDFMARSKMMKCSTLTSNHLSIPLTNDQLFKSQKMTQEHVYDLRIQSLTIQLEHKNKKIEYLKEQLRNLKQKKSARTQISSEDDINELTMLKQVKKFKKQKEEQLCNEDSSLIEPAFENAKKIIDAKQIKDPAKIKLTTKPSMAKKIFA